jgi:adenylyl-sulfate kinase
MITLILKSIGWRVIATILTAVIAWTVTGSVAVAVSIGFVDTVIKLVVYYLYDLVWFKCFNKPRPARVVWLTGLSGAGKTTIAESLARKLRRQGRPAVILDGDYIRNIFPTGFDPASREAHIRRVGQIAAILEAQNIIPIVSLISPYRKGREEARSFAKNFLEIYISTALEVCRQRDPKGLYAKVKRGEIKNFTGIDAPYERPETPELILDTTNLQLSKCVDMIIKSL